MEKVLTVVVPTYHVEKYIAKCLDSFIIPEIMDQIEILVIDDGGKDHSAQIAETYEKRHPETFLVIHKENGGHGSTINMGLDLAKGKYFKVVDGDDWVDHDGFLRLVHHLLRTDADMVLSNYYWVDHATGKFKAEVEEVCPGIVYGQTYPIEEMASQIFMKMHAITFRTAVIRDQPERLDEHCYYVDTEYMLFPLPYVRTISAVPDFVYQYRIGLPGQSMSPESMQKRCAQHEKVLYRLLEFYKSHRDDSCSETIRNTVARIAVSQYKIYLSFKESHKKEMIRLEKKLASEFPEVYTVMTNKAVIALRKSKYLLYPMASAAVRRMCGN